MSIVFKGLEQVTDVVSVFRAIRVRVNLKYNDIYNGTKAVNLDVEPKTFTHVGKNQFSYRAYYQTALNERLLPGDENVIS